MSDVNFSYKAVSYLFVVGAIIAITQPFAHGKLFLIYLFVFKKFRVAFIDNIKNGIIQDEKYVDERDTIERTIIEAYKKSVFFCKMVS